MYIYSMNLVDKERAVELLRAGELLIVPTDTVHGICCDYQNLESVRNIFEIKGRSEKKPLILLIGSLSMLDGLVNGVTGTQRKLMSKFWPGALTIIFKKSARVSDTITAGGSTIGVRMPAQSDVLALISELGRPIVATSVNISGSESLLTLSDISAGFPNVAILDGVSSGDGVASTVLDASGEFVKILRQGSLSKEEIEECLREKVISVNS